MGVFCKFNEWPFNKQNRYTQMGGNSVNLPT